MRTLGRTWGDGLDRKGAHLIADISFAQGFAVCIDGTRIEQARGLTLEDAWDIHRGKASLVTERLLMPSQEERANDDEVSAFLTLAANPAYEYEATE